MEPHVEDNHHKTVYAEFGAAMYYAQCLEHGLVNALVYLDLIPNQGQSISSSEWAQTVDGFMDRHFEHTLGKLIRTLASITVIPTDLESLLQSALETRNWLAHDYFRERATAWASRHGRDAMIAELQNSQAILRAADRLLDSTFKPIREKYGFTDERLRTAYEQMITEARASDSIDSGKSD